jgi:ADP-ribose pyrophosphatase
MKVEILREDRVFDDFFKIDKATLKHERFDGSMSEPITRLNFNRGDSVGVLLWNPVYESVILVRQFRYPAYVATGDGWIYEIVAGMIDEGKTAIGTAHAELLEEAGYKVDKLDEIGTCFLSPGGTSEKIILYLGTLGQASEQFGCTGGLVSEGEDIQIIEVGLNDAFGMIESGEICDAKTIIALQWLGRH